MGNEHKAALKYGKSDVSTVAEHVWVDKHDLDFQSVSVLAWKPDIHQRLSLESYYIRTLKTFNREKWVLDTKYMFIFFLISHSLASFFCHIIICIYFY